MTANIIPRRRAHAASVLAAFCLVLVGACQPDQREVGDTASAAADGVQETAAIQESSRCTPPEPAEAAGTHMVSVYFACESGIPGQLYPVHRRVPEDEDPVQATLEEMLRGPTDAERARGFRSLFSEATAGMLHGVTRSSGGDTLVIDFADFRAALGESPTPTSFLPGGVMADITWTVFQQFPEVQALRLAFDGSERAFWSWVAGERTEPQVFTREDWEKV